MIDSSTRTLFNGRPERHLWEIRADGGSERDVAKYQITTTVEGELKTFSKIEPDAALVILFHGRLVAMPAIYEIETEICLG